MKPSHLEQLSSDLSFKERRQLYRRISEFQHSNPQGQAHPRSANDGKPASHPSPLRQDYVQVPLLLRLALVFFGLVRGTPPELVLHRLRLRKLARKLQGGHAPLLHRNGRQWFASPALAQKVFAFYNHLFQFPFDRATLDKTSRSMAAYFLSSAAAQQVQLEINSFYSKEEMQEVVAEGGHAIALWSQVKERMEEYFRPRVPTLAKELLSQSAFVFQIAQMKTFPYRKFFTLFCVIEIPDNNKPNFQAAPLDENTKRLLIRFFRLMEETGPLITPPSTKELIFSEKPALKSPIVERLDEGMHMLKTHWAKLLESPQSWDLLRFLTGDYHLPPLGPRQAYQTQVKEIKEALIDHYFLYMKKQFDQQVSLAMVQRLNDIKQTYFPETFGPLEFYRNRSHPIVAALHRLEGNTQRPTELFFKHEAQLILLRDFCHQWLAKQLPFLERLNSTVQEGQALRVNGAKILETLVRLEHNITSLDHSLAPRSPRGLQLKDLKTRLELGRVTHTSELSKLMDEIDGEAKKLVEDSTIAIERLLGYVKRLIRQYTETEPAGAPAIAPEEERVRARLRAVGQGLTDFLYFLHHHHQLTADPPQE